MGEKNKQQNKHNNSKSYWNLQVIKDSIDKIKDDVVMLGLLKDSDLKRCKKNKSFLVYLQELLEQKCSENNKNYVNEIISRINIIQLNVYYAVEHLIYLVEPYKQTIQELDPSGILIDKIKDKIKCAVERYNGKWTTFKRRIKTDIFREIEKVEKRKVYYFSHFDNSDTENNGEKYGYQHKEVFDENVGWNFVQYFTPEDALIMKEQEKGLFQSDFSC